MEMIPGLPDRSDYGDLSKLTPGQLVNLLLQQHDARRAGRHYDLRLGDESTGQLLSWAVRKGLPAPGKRHLAVQQPVHEPSYAEFEGEIPSGYGAGTVRKAKQGRILITSATPQRIEFSTADERYPQRYVLFRPKNWKNRDWLLANITPRKGPDFAKVHYTKLPAEKVDEAIRNLREGSTVSAKIDGAAAFLQLLRNGVDVLSYRTSKTTGGPIVHTERVFGKRPEAKIPPHLVGSVVRGELYGVRKGKAIPPQELGGILNAAIENALARQKDKDIALRQAVFDVYQYGKKRIDPTKVPYAERQKMLREILQYLPPETFHEPPAASTPNEALALWTKIRKGKHPLTQEGIVIQPPTGKPTKAKLLDEYDVYVREFFPGQGKYQNRGVGGFRYSLTPDGPILGEVGTGLSDALRREMLTDPDASIGRIARVRAQGAFPSGALRAPALLALHEG